MSSDTLTVLRCAAGLRMCKLIRADGVVVGYDSARLVEAAEVAVADLSHLRRHLVSLMRRPRCCVVRGSLINGPRVQRMRRLLYADRETGDPATLDDVPRTWAALDMEGIALPVGTSPADVTVCAEHAIQTLPSAFRDARCLAQASASHGLKDGIRLRLWFWLSRPTGGKELERWLVGAPADRAVFRAAQPIYTAAPLFEDERQDPVPRRLVELPGADRVEVPAAAVLAPAPRRAAKAPPMPTDTGAQRYAARALTNAVLRVATASVNSRHETCIQEARGLGRLVKAGLLGGEQVKEALAGALEQAGKQRGEGLLAATWGLANPTGAALPTGVG